MIWNARCVPFDSHALSKAGILCQRLRLRPLHLSLKTVRSKTKIDSLKMCAYRASALGGRDVDLATLTTKGDASEFGGYEARSNRGRFGLSEREKLNSANLIRHSQMRGKGAPRE